MSWTCQRQEAGVVCKHRNENIYHRCQGCGKRRPPRKRPAHLAALDVPYEEYVRLNGGEFCGICGNPPKPGRRLDRDHDHATGEPRGLLCGIPCNKMLGNRVTADWLRRAADYLERST